MSSADIDSDDYYRVLGISRGASEKDIQKAYRKLAMKYHPDMHNTEKDKSKAETQFKKIGEAYAVLSDAKQKKTYDQFGKDGLKGGGGMGGFSFENANDIFSNLFGGGGSGFSFADMDGDEKDGFQFMFGGPGGRRGGFPGGMGGGFPGGMFGHGGGHGHRQQRRKAKNPILSDGTKVVVRNLVKANVHNEKIGVVEEYDGHKDRYLVAISDEHKLRIKIQNMMQRTECEIKGLDADNGSYNGKKILLAGYQDGANKYICEIDGKKIGLPPDNLLFPNDLLVRVHGLKGATQWNGHWGKIVEYLADKGRYRIQLLTEAQGGQLGDSIDQSLDLKPQNFQP